VLETDVGDMTMLREWERRVQLARRELHWPTAPERAVVHLTGASLSLAAPVDQLFTATEVNE